MQAICSRKWWSRSWRYRSQESRRSDFTYSAPSSRARATTRRPIMPPPSAPISQSMGKWMPAHSRDRLASSARASSASSSAGKRWPRPSPPRSRPSHGPRYTRGTAASGSARPGWVGRDRSLCPVGVFRIPATDEAIGHRHAGQGQHPAACGGIQPVADDQVARNLDPESGGRDRSRSPSPEPDSRSCSGVRRATASCTPASSACQAGDRYGGGGGGRY